MEPLVDDDEGPGLSEPAALDPEPVDGLPARLARTVSMNYLASGATLLSALALTPILLRELGTATSGVWSLALKLRWVTTAGSLTKPSSIARASG